MRKLLIVIALLYTVLFYFVPPLLDDTQFQAAYLNANNGSPNFSFSAWLDYMTELSNYDNARISNKLSPFSTLIEPWKSLFPIISGCVMAGLMALITFFVGNRKFKSRYLCLIWFMTITVLPWRNNMIVADYMLNYAYAAFITLLFAYLLLNGYPKDSTLKMILTVILAILAGGWHEGFAIPLAGGLSAYLVLKKFRLPWQWYVVFLIFVISIPIFFICPGMIERLSREAGNNSGLNYVEIGFNLILVLFLLISILTGLFFSNTRKRIIKCFTAPVFLVFFVTMVLAVIMSLGVHTTTRTAFWPEICAIICTLILYRPLIDKILTKNRNGIWICSVLYILCMIHGIIVIPIQKRYYMEYKDIMTQFRAGNSTIFYDIIPVNEAPNYTLYFFTRTHWLTIFNYETLENLFGREEVAVVPETLRHASEENSTHINGDLGLYVKGNAGWVDGNTSFNEHTGIQVDLILKDGRVLKNRPSFARLFTTEDGRKLIYVQPINVSADDIRSASFAR